MFQYLFLEGVVGFDFLIPGKERDMRQRTGDCITEITAETVITEVDTIRAMTPRATPPMEIQVIIEIERSLRGESR